MRMNFCKFALFFEICVILQASILAASGAFQRLFRKYGCADSITPVPLSTLTGYSELRCAAACSGSSDFVVWTGPAGVVSCACYSEEPESLDVYYNNCPSRNLAYTLYKDWNKFLHLRGSTYCLHSAEDRGNVDPQTAKSHCAAMGGMLPEADSVDDFAAILNSYTERSATFVWMGAHRGSDAEGTSSSHFYWDQTGEMIPGDSELWNPGQPNLNSGEKYISMYFGNTGMDDGIWQGGAVVCMIPCSFY